MVLVGVRVLTVFLGVRGASKARLRTGELLDLGDWFCPENVGSGFDFDRLIGVS